MVSNRVKAGPNDKLPSGATEAEFAYLKAQSIKADDEPYGYFGSKRDDDLLMPGAAEGASGTH